MKLFAFRCIALSALATSLLCSGCQTSQTASSTPKPVVSPRKETAIPWNRPAQWEGGGGLGGVMQGTR